MSEDQGPRLGPDHGFVSLVTDRLTIRRFRASDVRAFAGYRSEPEVARYQSWAAPFSTEQAHRFIDALAASDPDTPGQWFQFAVTESASGRLLGDVAAGIDADPRLARIGFTLAPAAQGRGFATEAVVALLDYLFRTRGKHRVSADCDPRNRASVRLLERLGFRCEAHHRRSAWSKGEWTDEAVYALLSDEWTGRRPEVAPAEEAERQPRGAPDAHRREA
jgi:RimJ/RimL family protein N-acetyltransferase